MGQRYKVVESKQVKEVNMAKEKEDISLQSQEYVNVKNLFLNSA